MADGFNRVMILGNLGADPELRTTSGGTAVLKMRVATTESYLDAQRQRQERTEWHNVVIWGKRAEGLARVLAKGNRIFVEGSLRTSSYEDREGVKRYKTDINAQRVVLCGGRGTPSATGNSEDDSDDGTLPEDGHGGPDDEFPF